ncbi:Serine/threonine-protein kinase pkn6 [Kiritimatiella glycovorans]|uniref:non-specific serine/threonine protein kinase n=2 Tax=Kiritimatiella glycovorans TaxID=1307763 RepID=A0A0G3EHI4_9BACT|nr:Serine/threonine-protein kinase pkn6 [Kiritimatiella glycovorans]
MNEPDVIVHETRIELVREIAEGAMSAVYEGFQCGGEGFRKRVAVKRLRPAHEGDERMMRLFLEEARLVCDLVHENIVQIYHFDRLDNGDYFMVMEYVHGLSLRDWMACLRTEEERIPEDLAVHTASRVARGLAYAHEFRDRRGRELDIVHRDVCPRNILVSSEGLAKLTDFGIAKASSNSVMGDNWITGKVPYMSPEQAACHPLDFRSDQYSLGAVLFEMLSGFTVRPGNMTPARDDFLRVEPPWNRLPPGTPAALESILRRLLAPDPEHRYARTADAARALEEFIYADGYGPTIQTVEAHLREQVPDLYRPVEDAPPKKTVTRRIGEWNLPTRAEER